MSLKSRITDDMKQAMRDGDKETLGAIRMIMAAIKQKEVDERVELDDNAVLGVLEKMLKQRRESVTQFAEAGRKDLVSREEAEIQVISRYMPEPLDAGQIEALVLAAIEQAGAQSMRDMGKVMALVRDQAQGRADMGAVSALVKSKLAG